MTFDPRAGLVVRTPTPLGDFVAAEPSLRALQRRFAREGCEERLTLCGPERMLALFAQRFPRATRVPAELPVREQVERFRGHASALLLTGSFRSAWIAWRAGVPRRIGFARDLRAVLLTDRVVPARERGRPALGRGVRPRLPRVLPRPVARSYVELVARLGVAVRDPRPRLAASPDVARAAGEALARVGVDAGRPFVVANVGGPPGAAKTLEPQRWVSVLHELERRAEQPTVLVFGPGEEQGAAEVEERLGRRVAVRLDGERPPGLEELVAVLGRAAACVTPDTGPRHLARAVGTPAVVLIGPTDPRHTGRAPNEVVLRRELGCSPCHLERCPLTGDAERACLRGIEPERVLRALTSP